MRPATGEKVHNVTIYLIWLKLKLLLIPNELKLHDMSVQGRLQKIQSVGNKNIPCIAACKNCECCHCDYHCNYNVWGMWFMLKSNIVFERIAMWVNGFPGKYKNNIFHQVSAYWKKLICELLILARVFRLSEQTDWLLIWLIFPPSPLRLLAWRKTQECLQ